MNEINEVNDMLFGTIGKYNEQTEPTIDWTVVIEDQEKFETIIDALDTFIDCIALIPDVEDLQRIHILGRLAFIRSNLAYCFNNEQIAPFIQLGKRLEQVLKDIINCSNWLNNAEQRLDEYIEFEEMADPETELTQKQIEHFRPVLMALAALSIITIDKNNFENEDEDFEEEDFEEECE